VGSPFIRVAVLLDVAALAAVAVTATSFRRRLRKNKRTLFPSV
jgi:hypothetical protein